MNSPASAVTALNMSIVKSTTLACKWQHTLPPGAWDEREEHAGKTLVRGLVESFNGTANQVQGVTNKHILYNAINLFKEGGIHDKIYSESPLPPSQHFC